MVITHSTPRPNDSIQSPNSSIMANLARIGFMCGVALLEPMHPTMVFI